MICLSPDRSSIDLTDQISSRDSLVNTEVSMALLGIAGYEILGRCIKNSSELRNDGLSWKCNKGVWYNYVQVIKMKNNKHDFPQQQMF